MFEREKEKLMEFQEFIDYKFKNKELLRQALTTPLLGNESGRSHYDNLETLGDAVIKTILISKKIEESQEDIDPEIITKTKQCLENDDTLKQIAKEYFKLEKFIFKSQKQEIEGTKILADVFEALCGAIFLDSNYNIPLIEKKIINIFYDDWDSLMDSTIFNKNKLLEYLQGIHKTTIELECKFNAEGPPWVIRSYKLLDRIKHIPLSINLPKNLKLNTFKSKKDAEQDLSAKILEYLKEK